MMKESIAIERFQVTWLALLATLGFNQTFRIIDARQNPKKKISERDRDRKESVEIKMGG